MTAAALETELSRFAAELDWDDLPAPVQDRVVDIWADAVANALAGRRAQNTPVVERLAARLGGPGESTVVGGATASMTAAAFTNGYQITAYTMCDVYRPALCHVTPEVVPAVLAAAEAGAASGRELLTALAVGLEVTTRLGLGVDYPVFRARGWHSPGVIGTLGAAVAAARVLGLDARGVRGAMGLGGSQAAGTFAALGTPAVKFHQARGAVSGLWAALFAADGLGGSEAILTSADGGLLATYAGGGQPDRITEGLGERWELEQISLRRWPAASSLQSLVAGLLDLLDETGRPDARHHVGADTVTGVEVWLPPTSYAMCADMGWQDELSAMQSARFVTSVLLHDRRCWTEQFGQARRDDPAVGAFARDRVTVSADLELGPSGVELRIEGRSFPRHSIRRHRVPGDPATPLTREDVLAKLAAAAGSTPTAATPPLDEVLLGAVDVPAVSLCAALRAAPPPPTGGSDSAAAR